MKFLFNIIKPHVIAGSAPILYLAVTGYMPFSGYFFNFMIPSLLGNIIGGVAFAAAINNAQAVAGEV